MRYVNRSTRINVVGDRGYTNTLQHRKVFQATIKNQ